MFFAFVLFFFLSVARAGAKNAYPFFTLEERIVCFMRDLNLFFTHPGPRRGEQAEDSLDEATSREQQQRNPLGAALVNISNQTDSEERQRWMDRVSFELHYITDQLGFYGLKKQTGGNALRLAHLLFSYARLRSLFPCIPPVVVIAHRRRRRRRCSMTGACKSSTT